jgi:YbgC/YbaW family acyl-CoA thioester hydrolase
VAGETFYHHHRVTYAECTIGDHVYYGRYLEIFEDARGEFFRHLGRSFLQWQECDTIFPVIDCHLRYRGAARYDDLLTIELWVETLEKIQLGFGYGVFAPPGRLLVEARTQHVCTNTAARPKRIPSELGAALAPYVRIGAGNAGGAGAPPP